jgi:SAM-dependent methyltransferase
VRTVSAFDPDPTRRFGNRVEHYIRYRPGYPPEVVDSLTSEFGLTRDHVIADIGSGTGILSELLLRNGNRVYGVEPNAEMRAAGAEYLKHYQGFTSVNGTAEATTLPNACVDYVTAGQAFHWFEPAAARQEFCRILRPGGWVVLIWNDRQKEDPFLRDYEQIRVAFSMDPPRVKHPNIDEDAIRAFFGDAPVACRVFDNVQILDWAGLQGRYLSSSYAPLPGDPDHGAAMTQLRNIFDRHQTDGRVIFAYHARLYAGQWA